jgi:hypothetical protein
MMCTRTIRIERDIESRTAQELLIWVVVELSTSRKCWPKCKTGFRSKSETCAK